MDVANLIKGNPLFRLAVPLMAGIAVADACGVASEWWLLSLLPAVLFMVAGLLSERLALLFGVGALSAMFFVGAAVRTADRDSDSSLWSDAKGNFSAVFVETPRMGERTVKALVMLTREDGDTVGVRRRGLAFLYLANCVDAENLKVGERITFTGKVTNPQNLGNPAEFDNERYLHIKGITGTAYLPVGGWSRDGCAPLSLRMRALALRERVVNLYASLGFGENEKAVLSALTIGDKSELAREVKDVYSSVGASHVLALSGLHLGIFYMILSVLLPMRRDRRFYSLLRELLILAVVWMFALVAGLSPSLLRAALLFTLFSLGCCLGRDASSVNSLALAAIVMLLVSPRSLFDVGFQLSFAAVFSILLFHPPLRRLFLVCGKVGGYVVDTLVVSFVAQVGTLPVVWYCFGKFPLYFLLTNMVVVPAAFLIMLLAVVLWVVAPIAVVARGVAWLLDMLLGVLNSFVGFVDGFPYASLELPYIDSVSAWGIAFCVALFLCCFCVKRRRVALFAVLTAVVAALSLWVWRLNTDEQKDYILFYNSRHSVAVQFVYSRETSYMLSNVEQRFAESDYVTAPFLRRHSFAEPRWVCGNFTDGEFSSSSGLVNFRGRNIKMLADDSWRNDSVSQKVDILFLCKGFAGAMDKVLAKYPTDRVVLDAGLHAMSRRRVLKECHLLGLFCLDISRAGAVVFRCDEENFAPHFVVER